MCLAFKDDVLECLEFLVAWAGDGILYVECACVTTPSMCRLSTRNACDPVKGRAM